MFDDTCQWILEDSNYTQWLQSGESAGIWLYSTPGKGKSVIALLVCDTLLGSNAPKDQAICYFFCDSSDSSRRSVVYLLRCWILQLLEQRPSFFNNTQHFVNPDTNDFFSNRNTLHGLWTVFELLVSQIDTMLVLDGLDELDHASLSSFSSKLSGLVSARDGHASTKVFVSSRRAPECIPNHLHNFGSIDLDSEAYQEVMQSGVRKFVTQTVTRTSRDSIDISSGQSSDDYIKQIIHESEGLYLMACMALKKSLTRTSRESSLSGSQEGLTSLVNRMLEDIPADERGHAADILRWVACALRPLTLEELANALKTNVSPSHDSASIISRIRLCGPLLSIRSGFVTFFHQSVKSVILRDNSSFDEIFQINQERSHLILGRRCLETFLEHRVVLEKWDRGADIPKEYSILHYASIHWPDHYRMARATPSLHRDFDTPLAKAFFYGNPRQVQQWWKLIQLHPPSTQYACTPEHFTVTHVASALGLPCLGEHAMRSKKFSQRRRTLACEPDSMGLTPLMWAAQSGHESMIEYLVSQGASINEANHLHGTSLHRAAICAEVGAARKLIDLGSKVSPSPLECRYGSTLQTAAIGGELSLIKLLHQQGAPIMEPPAGWFGNSLQAAAVRGFGDVLHFLVIHGGDVNAVGGWFRSPLIAACSTGSVQCVKILLEAGAEAERQFKPGSLFTFELGKRQLVHHVRQLPLKSIMRQAMGERKVVAKAYAKQKSSNEGQDGFRNAMNFAMNQTLQELQVTDNDLNRNNFDEETVAQLNDPIMQEGVRKYLRGLSYRNAREAAIGEGHEEIIRLLDNHRNST